MTSEKVKEKNRLKAKKHMKKVKEYNKTHEIKTDGVNQTCHKCKVKKPITDFPKDATKKSGFGGKCKACKLENNYFDANVDPHVTKKECSGKGGCGEEKFLIYFSKQKQGKFGYANLCTDCRKIKRRIDLHPERPSEGEKCCAKCKKTFEVANFSADKYSKDGLQSVCRKCQCVKTAVTQSKFSSFIKKILNDANQRSKKKNIQFDITKENIETLYEKQKGLCALSGTKMTYNAINDRQEGDCHILNPDNISIDRIDPNQGYVKNNIQLVCAIVNRIKFEMTECELFDFCCQVIQTEYNNIIKKFDKAFGIKLSYNVLTSNKLNKFINYKYSNMTHNAKSRDLKVNLTQEQILDKYKKQNGYCALTGIKMTYSKKSTDLSIDRINSGLDYTVDNIHLITNSANSIRSDIDIKTLIEVCHKLKLFYLTKYIFNACHTMSQ